MPHSLDAADLLLKASLETVLAKVDNRTDVRARFERVKAAALMECAENGYTNLTMVGIAKRAKVSTASIYTAYPDRDGVLVAAMEMLFSMLADDVIELPQTTDPQEQVEQLLISHGLVYLQPLTLWTFRLHMMLTWASHEHLRDIGQKIFRNIDAFWRSFLSELVTQGHLREMDLDTVVPLLLGPIERCTIISRLACGDDENGRPSYIDAAKYGAKMLFAQWGNDAGRSDSGTKPAINLTSSDMTDNALSQKESLERASHLDDLSLAGVAPPHERLLAQLSLMSQRQNQTVRREKLLLGAAVSCQRHGYKAASMQDVAELSRISTASIYKNFADKADLFVSALENEVALRGTIPKPAKEDEEATTDCIAQAVFTITQRSINPQWGWMHNIMMGSEISGNSRVVEIARHIRHSDETFLEDVLVRAPRFKGLSKFDRAMLVNGLLGGVERRGVLSLLLFGRASVDSADLAIFSTLAAKHYCSELLALS